MGKVQLAVVLLKVFALIVMYFERKRLIKETEKLVLQRMQERVLQRVAEAKKIDDSSSNLSDDWLQPVSSGVGVDKTGNQDRSSE